MRKARESYAQLVRRLVPCTVKYWTPEAHALNEAAEQGLCKQTILGFPWWRFTNKRRNKL